MSMTLFTALAMFGVAPANAGAAPVGHDALIAGQPAVAISQIEANDALDSQDPALLLNRGIALANLGETEAARVLFEAVMRSQDRMALETTTGEWKDSRHLARKAIRMLDQGKLSSTRIAAR